MVALSAYMGGTRGSGVLSSAGDVLEMSMVRACWWSVWYLFGLGGVRGIF